MKTAQTKTTIKAISELKSMKANDSNIIEISEIALITKPAIKAFDNSLEKAEATLQDYASLITLAISRYKGVSIETVLETEAGSESARAMVKSVKIPLLNASFPNDWTNGDKHEARWKNAVKLIFKAKEKLEAEKPEGAIELLLSMFDGKTLADIVTAKKAMSWLTGNITTEETFAEWFAFETGKAKSEKERIKVEAEKA